MGDDIFVRFDPDTHDIVIIFINLFISFLKFGHNEAKNAALSR